MVSRDYFSFTNSISLDLKDIDLPHKYLLNISLLIIIFSSDILPSIVFGLVLGKILLSRFSIINLSPYILKFPFEKILKSLTLFSFSTIFKPKICGIS